MELRKATRLKSKLRIGMSGPSGSGKTYSALVMAKAIANGDMTKVAIIDTENGSADLYSHLGEFNALTLQAPYAPERYIEAIKKCVDAGMEVVIVDSTSHEWDGKGGCLEINELIAKTKFKGNTWAAWSDTTPRHQKFIEAITTAPVHMITTARSKTDTIQTEDKKIKKVGLKEIQREGFEYELTLNFTIDRDGHYAIASKDRTGLFIDRDPFIIDEKIGAELKAWADTGVVPPPPVDPRILEMKKDVIRQIKALGIAIPDDATKLEFINKLILEKTHLELKDENLELINVRLGALVQEHNIAMKKTAPAEVPPAYIPPQQEITTPEVGPIDVDTLTASEVGFGPQN